MTTTMDRYPHRKLRRIDEFTIERPKPRDVLLYGKGEAEQVVKVALAHGYGGLAHESDRQSARALIARVEGRET